MELKPGIKIHGYTLDKFINSGATAEVWRIRDEFGIEKALKIFSPVQKVDDSTLDMLIDEFKLLYKLDHPHILRSEIMGAHQKVPYIIMPYYDGNLAAEMTRRFHQGNSSALFNSWFSEEECLQLMEQIGSGLAYLHQQGIIHQDVKPENILFDSTAVPVHYVLTDFGISTKIKENIARMTMPRQQAYALTPAYAAPEQFKGRQDYKSDVFSLVVLLFEMCEGRLPFTRHGYAPDSYGNIPIPEFRNVHLSTLFKHTILSALTEDPEIRPSAKELADFAIHARGNRITASDSDLVRTDKITVIQPSTGRSQGDKYVDLDEMDDMRNNIRTVPNKLGDDIVYPDNPHYRNNPQKEKNTSKSKSRNGVRVGLIIGGIVLLGALLFGYQRYRKVVGKALAEEANQLFESGKIKEANTLFSKLANSNGDEKYYAAKFLTDRILAEQYEAIGRFTNDRAPVSRNGKWGFINNEGKLVIKCQYKQVEEFNDHTAAVCLSDNEWGIIDLNGNEKAPFEHSGMQSGGKDKWKMIRIVDGKRISIDYNY